MDPLQRNRKLKAVKVRVGRNCLCSQMVFQLDLLLNVLAVFRVVHSVSKALLSIGPLINIKLQSLQK